MYGSHEELFAVRSCTGAGIDMIMTVLLMSFFFFKCGIPGPSGADKRKKNYMKKWNVGKARRALWCISLIYYLPDFQTLIPSTLEEESPPPFSCSTCDIGARLSVFSIDYNIFRAFIGATPGASYFLHNQCFIPWTHGGIHFPKNKNPIHPVFQQFETDLLILYDTSKFLPSCVWDVSLWMGS